MKMHILIGKSTCHLSYFEVSVGGKNALDHQISTWLGYLIGTGAAERSYYIAVSYTHLDVYKRQSQRSTRNSKVMAVPPVHNSYTNSITALMKNCKYILYIFNNQKL